MEKQVSFFCFLLYRIGLERYGVLSFCVNDSGWYTIEDNVPTVQTKNKTLAGGKS